MGRSLEGGEPSRTIEPETGVADRVVAPSSKRKKREIVLFDPDLPLLEQLLKELSFRYIDNSPDIRPALNARRDEAGVALETIARNTSLHPLPRTKALSLISALGYPQAREVCIAMTKDRDADLRNDAIETLAARGEEGNADAILNAYEQSIKGSEDRRGSSTVLRALVRLGDSRVLPMLEDAIGRARQEYPDTLAAYLENRPDLPELYPRMFKSMLESYELEKQLVTLANTADPITPAIQLLYQPDGARDWALQFLKRKNPPGLAAHVRAAYDSFKGMSPRWRESHRWYLHECLETIQSCGGVLTSSEAEYLSAVEESVDLPALPD
jgi:hypothetical protein